MKKTLILSLIAVMLLPLSGFAQDIFAKYSDNEDVTYVNIKPKMFQLLAKIDVDTDDPESQAYLDMVKSITSFKTIMTGNKTIATDLAGYVKTRKNSLEELMEVKDDGVNVNFYIKEGKDADHVKELLIFVNGLDKVMKDNGVEINGKKREMESVLVSFSGDIDLNQLSKLLNKMNVPGGKHLDKKKR